MCKYVDSINKNQTYIGYLKKLGACKLIIINAGMLQIESKAFISNVCLLDRLFTQPERY